MTASRFQTGFTLIELLMVLAIVITLATIAIPQYQNTLPRQPCDGISAIQNILVAQERYFTDHMAYTTDLSKLGSGLATFGAWHVYTLAAAACSSSIPLTQCVKITATAFSKQSADGNLVATSQGAQISPSRRSTGKMVMSFKVISLKDAKTMVENGELNIADIRDALRFQAGRICQINALITAT